MKRQYNKNPWAHAMRAGRDYVTPEDIQHAIDAGAAKLTLWRRTLEAIAQGKAEDHKACAFVALGRL